MQDSKKGFSPFRHGVHLSKQICPRTQEEREKMRNCPYASSIGSLMYAMLRSEERRVGKECVP